MVFGTTRLSGDVHHQFFELSKQNFSSSFFESFQLGKMWFSRIMRICIPWGVFWHCKVDNILTTLEPFPCLYCYRSCCFPRESHRRLTFHFLIFRKLFVVFGIYTPVFSGIIPSSMYFFQFNHVFLSSRFCEKPKNQLSGTQKTFKTILYVN